MRGKIFFVLIVVLLCMLAVGQETRSVLVLAERNLSIDLPPGFNLSEASTVSRENVFGAQINVTNMNDRLAGNATIVTVALLGKFPEGFTSFMENMFTGLYKIQGKELGAYNVTNSNRGIVTVHTFSMPLPKPKGRKFDFAFWKLDNLNYVYVEVPSTFDKNITKSIVRTLTLIP